MANNPRHGDAIIKTVTDPIGGTKLIASNQFQAFLDTLGANIDSGDNESTVDIEQNIESLSLSASRLRGLVNRQEAVIEQQVAQIAILTIAVNDQGLEIDDLEQLIHVNKR